MTLGISLVSGYITGWLVSKLDDVELFTDEEHFTGVDFDGTSC